MVKKAKTSRFKSFISKLKQDMIIIEK